eukprot:CAMPEP_0177790334 /NCGR_PEP_ID=MMETSP0491_2-20121128/23288_1 /TAXON_ID=63592 /ORGANISM="Tetraselmis chuii, Strain PLY429" /LENGTH=77 /DNA_ID=CAMNT_0019312379 /DNA_START=67 /DNA_END=296 /DNA_ORIENTATION=+
MFIRAINDTASFVRSALPLTRRKCGDSIINHDIVHASSAGALDARRKVRQPKSVSVAHASPASNNIDTIQTSVSATT